LETVVRDVRDLNLTDRSVLERVVGHELLEDQKLVIQVVSGSPDTPLTDDEAAKMLERILPSNEQLRAMAATHRPPNEWFEHDEERPF
jgi:hypothetical protein